MKFFTAVLALTLSLGAQAQTVTRLIETNDAEVVESLFEALEAAGYKAQEEIKGQMAQFIHTISATNFTCLVFPPHIFVGKFGDRSKMIQVGAPGAKGCWEGRFDNIKNGRELANPLALAKALRRLHEGVDFARGRRVFEIVSVTCTTVVDRAQADLDKAVSMSLRSANCKIALIDRQ